MPETESRAIGAPNPAGLNRRMFPMNKRVVFIFKTMRSIGLEVMSLPEFLKPCCFEVRVIYNVHFFVYKPSLLSTALPLVRSSDPALPRFSMISMRRFSMISRFFEISRISRFSIF